MNITKLLSPAGLAAALALGASALGAQTMGNLQLGSSSIAPGEAVTVSVDVDFSSGNTPLCAIEVNYGDGSTEHRRVEARELNNGRLFLQHSYQSAGVYTLRIEGKTMFRGFKTAMACHGASLERSVTVGRVSRSAAPVQSSSPAATRDKPRQPATRERHQAAKPQHAPAAAPKPNSPAPAPAPAAPAAPAKKKPVIAPF
jgi:hypothetical protein